MEVEKADRVVGVRGLNLSFLECHR
jgi:hypothetical protein